MENQTAKPWRVAGINFAHMHMGDLLRDVARHRGAELVGICDEDPHAMAVTISDLSLSQSQVFTDYRECLEQTRPDLVVLCPPTGEHALWVERVAPFGPHLFVEKPFAASLEDADSMIAAAARTGKELIINWPARWQRSHYTAWSLINEGWIGEVSEVHHYGGNRGPLFHVTGKAEREPTEDDKRNSWWYQRDLGGGSLRDYLGYGVTLGTWFNGGRKPIDVTCVTTGSPDLEVDEHSITIARYENGMSKFETRWGTFSDPWIHQPQPKCGYVICGSDGTISSDDYATSVRVQTRQQPDGFEHPVQELPEGERNGIEYTLSRLGNGLPIEGPSSPRIARIGQQIIETAIRSSESGKTELLVE